MASLAVSSLAWALSVHRHDAPVPTSAVASHHHVERVSVQVHAAREPPLLLGERPLHGRRRCPDRPLDIAGSRAPISHSLSCVRGQHHLPRRRRTLDVSKGLLGRHGRTRGSMGSTCVFVKSAMFVHDRNRSWSSGSNATAMQRPHRPERAVVASGWAAGRRGPRARLRLRSPSALGRGAWIVGARLLAGAARGMAVSCVRAVGSGRGVQR